MAQLKKIFFALPALFLIQGCAHEKIYDIEQIATGGYIARGVASTWSEPAGTAAGRATREATKYCQHEGREVKIRGLKTHPGNSSLTEIAEAEFDCAPLPSHAPR
jgi:hypothetical protein